jgi:muramoyltetrapeptide carboxypeptidase
MHFKTPRALRNGDSVGVVAPGSPFDRQKFAEGISIIENLGFHPVFSHEIFQEKGYLAGSDRHRADMLNEAFTDDAIRAVFCARGGYGALRILDYLDFDLIGSHPKIFMGYSDMSVILNALWLKCHMVSFHGPMIESLAAADDRTIKSFYETLCGHQRLSVQPQKAAVLQPGSCRGRVAGGNLTTLCHLIGTPYQPDFSGCILLLEDTGEAPYRIDRMLSQMKMAGCFEKIAGIILGSFEKCDNIADIYTVFSDIFSEMQVPILAGFDIGHGQPNITIPFGVDALLDTHSSTLTYQYPHLEF